MLHKALVAGAIALVAVAAGSQYAAAQSDQRKSGTPQSKAVVTTNAVSRPMRQEPRCGHSTWSACP